MRIHEILTEDVEQLDEFNWKKAAAAATLAGASLFGAGQADAQNTQSNNVLANVMKQESQSIINNMEALTILARHAGSASYRVKDFNPQAVRSYEKIMTVLKSSSERLSSGEKKKLEQAFLKSAQWADDNRVRFGANYAIIMLEKTFDDIKSRPDLWSKNTKGPEAPVAQSKSQNKDIQYLEDLKGYLDHSRSEGPITKQVVQQLGSRGLQNMMQSYNNFSTDLASMKDPKLIEKHKSLLSDLKKDIDLYKSYLGQSDNKPTAKMSDADAKKAAGKAARKAFDDANGFSKYNK